MTARVVFTSGFSRLGGVREFTVEAKKWTASTPVSASASKKETTVAIDGWVHETAYFQPIRDGFEVFFIPELEGG